MMLFETCSNVKSLHLHPMLITLWQFSPFHPSMTRLLFLLLCSLWISTHHVHPSLYHECIIVWLTVNVF